jgi:hypothetical protein
MGALADFIDREMRGAVQTPNTQIEKGRAAKDAKPANPASRPANFSNFSNFSRGVGADSNLAKSIAGPEVHRCGCGSVGIHGDGWFLREPGRARWYCSECFGSLRASGRA